MKLSIYKTDGTNSGKKAELSDDIFKCEPNDTLIYEDIRSYLASKRQGTAKVKERNEVRGGGRKAYRQKGTGMARRGTMRSPLLKGGGIVHGPRPRNYNFKLPANMKRAARKSALSYKAGEKAIKVVDDFTYDEPKTKKINELITSLELDGKKVLLLTAEADRNVHRSATNLKKVNVLEANKPSTYDIVNSDVIIVQKSAVKVLEESVKSKTRGSES